MEGTNTIFTAQFLISGLISALMSVGFILWQYKEFHTNVKAIKRLGRFFLKNEEYSSSEVEYFDGRRTVTNVLIKDVAEDGSELKNLIRDINAYIKKSKGTVAFSIIQNKTERRISMLYEIATSKLSFPTHIGLMGTFAGVFVGLVMFLVGTLCSGGITDSTIQSLITGVLVSMLTSCCGIWMLITSHREASATSNQVDKDKNEFYEWVQNELMPSVDVSMVEAIGKLHETIDQFEPSFSGVISEFKNAFRDVTGAFGTDFRESVKVVSSAVKRMGENMDKVNRNIKLQDDLLDTIRSRELIKGMDAFVEASHKFSEITGSLDQFERARRLMLVAAQETINIQKDFNESLDVPKQVAADINMILDRVRNFENRINLVGEAIAQTKMVGSKTVEQIEQSLFAIKKMQDVAKDYAEMSNAKLKEYFEHHKVELGRIAARYNKALESYLEDYEKMLVERKEELEQRKREFTDAIDEKFSIEDIRTEFTALKKLNTISEKVDQLAQNSVTGDKLNKALEGIRLELDAMIVAQEKQSKGLISGLVGGSSAATERMLQARDKAVQEAEIARQNEAAAKQQVALLQQKLGDLDRKFNQLNGYVDSLTRNRSVQQTYSPQRPVATSQLSTNTVTSASPKQTTVTKDQECAKPVEVDRLQIINSDEGSANSEFIEDERPEKKQGFWSKLFHKK